MNELESLKGIFKDRIFKIPDYQRGYAWTIRQLKDFWEDLVNLPIDKYHYTGLLSIKKVDKKIWNSWNDERWLIEERGYKPFHIVDGQQRLTTFIIFVQAIVELIKNLPENADKKEADVYIGSFNLKFIKEEYLVISKPPQFIINTYKFSYETDNPSFRFLKHRILNEPDCGTIQETFYTLNLENAKNFFLENLQAYLKKYGRADIENLFKKLTQNLMYNIYEISEDFDVFVAFETMNNRGKKLSNLELLKNRLIYLTTLYNENELKEDVRISLREKINDAWKEIYYQLGRNKQYPLNDDDFLSAHWIIYFQYSRVKGDDYIRYLLDRKFTPQNIYTKMNVKTNSIEEYEEVREKIESDLEDNEASSAPSKISRSALSPKEIEEYVNSLKATAIHWYNTHYPVNNIDLTEEEQLWLDRLNRIGISYFRPLVVASFLNNQIKSIERTELFTAIERWIFIAFRLSRDKATFKSSEFYNAARELRINNLSAKQLVLRLNSIANQFNFYNNEGSEERYFGYSSFFNFIEKKFKSGGGFYQWNDLRYFLYEYEMEKVRERGSQKIDWKLFTKGENDKVSIEHILPQTTENTAWENSFDDYDDDELEYLKGTLGNLLPLSQSINSSLQNDSFSDKKIPKQNTNGQKIRQGYYNGSHSEIEVSSYNDWTAETILERGLKLLDFMERRWSVKFEDEEHKINMLFLNFLLPEDEEQAQNEPEDIDDSI